MDHLKGFWIRGIFMDVLNGVFESEVTAGWIVPANIWQSATLHPAEGP